MKHKRMLMSIGTTAVLAVLATGAAISAQDKYTVKVPNGLGFAEFRGFESWQVISVSHGGQVVAAILGNPAMIQAYAAGIPDNGKPFPDGARMAKIHWDAKQATTFPGQPTVSGNLYDVDFMVKDAKRFADSGGWGYAAFKYDNASDSFKPADLTAKAPQGNDAKCGFACHTVVKNRDYVFSEYGKR